MELEATEAGVVSVEEESTTPGVVATQVGSYAIIVTSLDMSLRIVDFVFGM